MFHTHQRHDGNVEAARAYLAWEVDLVGRLDDQERGSFRIAGVLRRSKLDVVHTRRTALVAGCPVC